MWRVKVHLDMDVEASSAEEARQKAMEIIESLPELEDSRPYYQEPENLDA